MYVFLALLQQMGIDGCLLGPPGAAKHFSSHVAYAADKATVLTGTPRGPFWAVGARIERDKKGDVKLYDPWRGEAFPATLSELRSKPDSYKAWFEEREAVSGMTSGDAKGAVVYLAVPVNSLAPRLAMLERKLKQTVDVKLAINPAQLRDRFPDPKPTFWNPAEDRFAYGRVARAFMPLDQGGEADKYDPRGRLLHDNYLLSLLPPAERVLPADMLQSQAVIENVKPRIEEMVKSTYAFAFLQPPTPREQIQRGQFQDAARALIERQDVFSKRLLRARKTERADKRMRDWVESAKRLYASLGPDAAANELIRANIDELWRSEDAALFLDRAMGEVGQGEAAMLLALCRHEQAERVQARLEHATGEDVSKLRQSAADAWETAVSEWSGYREQFSGVHSGSPARVEHIRALADRAKRLAGRR
jgi:hypothetical protein